MKPLHIFPAVICPHLFHAVAAQKAPSQAEIAKKSGE